jgi:hypothetical protein
MGYKQQLKPIFERLMGQVELALMGRMEEFESRRVEEEWNTVDCPAIVQLFVNKQREFARFIMAASSQDEAVGDVMKLQGTWDKNLRKFKGKRSRTRKKGVCRKHDKQYIWRYRTR